MNLANLPKSEREAIDNYKKECWCRYLLKYRTPQKREIWLKKQNENEQAWRDLLDKVRDVESDKFRYSR